MTGFKAQLLGARAEVESLADLLAETLDPPPAISTVEAPEGWLIEIYFEDEPDLALIEAVTQAHPLESAVRAMMLEPLPEEDWVAATQRGLHPIEAGRFFIHGSHDRARAKSYAIEIDAGQAFGTAHHGTTRGCLIMLDRLAKRVRPERILDLGTGSGVLAIAAAKAFRRNVLATDIDPLAISVATDNFTHNGVAGYCRGLVATGLHHPQIESGAPFDLITANILAGPLIKLASEVSRIAAPGGHLILSGLLDHQAREVSAHYRAHGFDNRSQLSLEGWSTLHLQRRD